MKSEDKIVHFYEMSTLATLIQLVERTYGGICIKHKFLIYLE